MNYYNKNSWAHDFPIEYRPTIIRYKWKCSDVGIDSYTESPPILLAFKSLINGLHYEYPLCCIEEFCIDELDGRHQAVRRGTVPDGKGGKYVPCSNCCKEMGREIIV